jgi:acyl carrier protein
MGLEVTELMMACEDEFGIEFDRHSERRLNRIETVADLYLCIMELIPDRQVRRCPWVSVFFPLRRKLAEQLGLDKRELRPDTPVRELIPESMGGRDWNRFRQRLPFKLPSLDVAVSLHVGGLIDHAVQRANSGFGRNGKQWDVDSVWDALREIVSDRFGVDIDRIGPETHFWHDLGAG